MHITGTHKFCFNSKMQNTKAVSFELEITPHYQEPEFDKLNSGD